ncbi:PREDICTED: uncharacterized protein LOC105566104 isoform X3 [Vollenhovia emeryi]|uniref:uncharacterized protein LOC105566104 isoform X3 n=1 Tax=Vollenhovia emeryi TaxID=411798 RepID=UPI0005F40DC8|nr:PREDICTED: uncharacterized protein LOC105566104 isoform X3 [Vollenhovia emeryi]
MIFVFRISYELIAVDFSNPFMLPLHPISASASHCATDVEPAQPVFMPCEHCEIRVRGEAHLQRYGVQIVSDPSPRLSTKNHCHDALNAFSEEVGTCIVGLMLVSVTLASDRSIVGWSVSQRSWKQTSSHYECLDEYFSRRDY